MRQWYGAGLRDLGVSRVEMTWKWKSKSWSKFGRSVVAQVHATKRGDAAKSDECAGDYVEAFNELTAHGDPGREALTSLFVHDCPEVRVMAAAFLLRYCEK